MPCRYDEPIQGRRDIDTENAVELYIWLVSQFKTILDKKIVKMAKDKQQFFSQEDANYVSERLCSFIRGLSNFQKERIIYNARNKMSRRLADWWEEHQEADRKREAEEKAEQERKRLVRQALSKLTTAERKALGL